MTTPHAAQANDAGRPATAALDPARWLEEHGDALFRFARQRGVRAELAEDLVQETFLAGLQGRHQFTSRAAVRTWLLAILRRKVVDHYRRASAAYSVAEAASAGKPDPVRVRYFGAAGLWRRDVRPRPTPPEILEAGELRQALNACLDRLPGALAGAFALREVESLDSGSVCAKLGISASALRVRLHRARLLLRECLERRGFGHNNDSSRPARSP